MFCGAALIFMIKMIKVRAALLYRRSCCFDHMCYSFKYISEEQKKWQI